MKIKIKIINDGKLPIQKRKGDACFDCFANCDCRLYPDKRQTIPLGFAIELPEGYEAIIRPRSSFSLMKIDSIIGTIDSNYRGEVNAIIQNNNTGCYDINKGDRICQMAIRKTEDVEFEIVEELSESNRGKSGFGSSGIN